MLYLVRYGEMALKSERVRRRFEETLASNIQDVFVHAGEQCIVERERGRFFVEADEGRRAMEALSRIFGIVSFSPVIAEPPSELEAAGRAAAQAVAGRSFRSFAIRSRRSGQHKFTSRDMAVAVGDAVSEGHPEAKVDLGSPELEVSVETRGPRTYIFIERHGGPGGLPLGTQGRTLAIVRSKEDLPAPWMMMKRGCHVHVMTPDAKLDDGLRPWDPAIRVFEGDPGDVGSVVDRLSASGAQALVLPGRGFPEGRPYGATPVFLPMLGLDGEGEARLRRQIERGSCLEDP